MCRVCSVETGDEELHISWYVISQAKVAVVRAYRLGVFREGSEFVLTLRTGPHRSVPLADTHSDSFCPIPYTPFAAGCSYCQRIVSHRNRDRPLRKYAYFGQS